MRGAGAADPAGRAAGVLPGFRVRHRGYGTGLGPGSGRHRADHRLRGRGGIYVIRHPLALATVLGYCLGVYLAVQGVSTLYDALRLHKAQHECGREILLGIIMLSGGILLLCFPLTSSRVVMMVLGVALAVIGVLQLVLRIRERQFPELHTGRPDIIDADE